MTQNEIVKEIPIVGTVLKLLRGGRDFRDRLFAAKLARFLRELDSVPTKVREKIREKVASNPKEARRVGETILIVLERAADIEKAEVIAAVFVAYAFGHVTVVELRRLCTAVDHAFLDDLLELLRRHELPRKSKDPFMTSLASAGLTTAIPGQTYGDIGELFYEVSPLGAKLVEAYRERKKSDRDGASNTTG